MANPGSDTARLLDSIQPESFPTDAQRYEAKEAARRLLARLETPAERGLSLTMETSVLLPALQICHDLGIWSKWAEINRTDHGSAAQTLDGIVRMGNTAIEPKLLRRFLRHLAALYVLEETDIDEWKPTPFSLAMGDRSTYIDQLVQCGINHCFPCGINLAPFLARHQYKEPLDTSEFDNHADTFGSVFFDYTRANPTAGSNFIGMMTALRNYKLDWTEVYDTQARLLDGAHGLDAARLLSKHPDLPAGTGIVVQDLPEVTSTHGARVRLDPRITRAAYDFFTPQPLVGARAYFFHAVPHDWPDKECARIFENVKGAMRRGYSRLLIYEMVLPAKGATSLMSTLDLQLMNCLSGLERTEEHWRRLLEGVGLRVVSVSRHPRAVESVIEAELA
ncbi:Demethylsterigmatocystin 6-O-methyltransferase [Cytospora mali]|uniref:Demethylsterigmatocystin 6-O-methyltransferase n=1 Tax=Cytospora mali TaxID=578113 RepID=A0A194VZ88_CYTMA|nr:Demethylsterigmatocystin 6-O-methyltransferase [Valsa mali]